MVAMVATSPRTSLCYDGFRVVDQATMICEACTYMNTRCEYALDILLQRWSGYSYYPRTSIFLYVITCSIKSLPCRIVLI